jgi:uncharacterized protein (DUF427 family)
VRDQGLTATTTSTSTTTTTTTATVTVTRGRSRARVGLLLLVGVLAVGGPVTVPAPARAAAVVADVDPVLQPAADALRSQFVYRDPAAESRLTDAEVGLLTKAVAGAGTPLWIALLPQSVLSRYDGSAQAVAQALADATGQPGTYAVVVGPSAFAAVSTVGAHPVDELARQAARSGPDPFDVLTAFVELMRTTYGSGAPGPGQATGAGSVFAVLVLVAAGGGALAIVSRRRRRAERKDDTMDAPPGQRDYPAALVPVGHVEPAPRRVRAVLGDETVADTTRAQYVWETSRYPHYYLPLADVRSDLLEPEGTVEQTARGPVELHGLRVGDTHRPAAARVLRTSAIPRLSGTVRLDWAALDAWYEEDEQVYVHARSPYVRVDALPSSRHVRVARDGVLLAETSTPVLLFETGLPTRFYIRRDDVDFSHLETSDTVTACPYKGTTGGYWSARIDGSRLHKDLAWCYELPTREVLPIAGMLAFYNERVDIDVDGVRLDRPRTHFWSGDGD